MAGGQERVLRRRIKSVQSTKKITRAMELIAATRVVKAQQRATAAKPYSRQITRVIENLAAGGTAVEHPLLREATDVKRVGLIAITSDRGLAGAYNTSVIRATEREVMAAELEGKDYSLVLIGKKAESYFRFRGYRVDAAFTGMSDTPRYEDAKAVADKVAELFESGHVDVVILVYTEFLSVGSQKVTVRRFLPLESAAVVATAGQGDKAAVTSVEFEPSPEAVLTALLPRYVEARLFGALLESAASEHASRQRAMKSATDNAEELRIKLSRQMNRARQDSITTEIMEIVGGAEAMRAGGDDELLDPVYIQSIIAASTGAPAEGSGVADSRSFAPASTATATLPKGVKADDLKIVEGIGPAIEALLHGGGIATWRDLASSTTERLREILAGGGSRFSMHDPTTWPTQAGLAADGRFTELQSLKDSLAGGRAADAD
jgi:F-type H+-transporting ATPase subunit gamma